MFLTEALRSDLFLAHSDFAGFRSARLHESHLQRCIRAFVHYAVDRVCRRCRHRTGFLTRHFKLHGEFRTHKERVQFAVSVPGEHGVALLNGHLVGGEL